MGKRIRQIVLTALAIAAAVFCGTWLKARPAAKHPYFAPIEFSVIAHRGGRGLGPENTLAAFRLSLAAGADVLEMDVRSTVDGHLVALHDDTVDRTTDGRGALSEMTLAELKKLDAGYRWTADSGISFPFRNRGITVPTLPEILTAIPDTPLIMEIKENRSSTSQSLCDALQAHQRTTGVLVASGHTDALENFRSVCPGVATAAGPSEALQFFLLSRLGLAFLYSPAEQALLVPETVKGREVPSPRFVEAAHGRNLKVAVWTVNAVDDMHRLISAGVDGIITDYPDRLAAVLGQ